jgi:alkaline phosphatase D
MEGKLRLPNDRAVSVFDRPVRSHTLRWSRWCCLAFLTLFAVRVGAEATPDEQSVPPPGPPSAPEGLPTGVDPNPDEESVQDWLRITHGIAVGEVTDSSAVIWARSSYPALMHVRLALDPSFARELPESSTAVAVGGEDFTAAARVDGLSPATSYHYRVWFTGVEAQAPRLKSEAKNGVFKTAPAPLADVPVSFAWGGQLGGQAYCRRAGHGYAIFSKIRALHPDFFLALGNMIYADEECPIGGPEGDGVWQNVGGDFPSILDPSMTWEDGAGLREVFWEHWRYDRADRHLRDLLAETCLYSIWGSHEVVGGFGANWSYWNSQTRSRPGFPSLVHEGRDAFLQYSPLNPGSTRLYRSFRWGRSLEVFLLDTRSFRSRDELADTPDQGKTILGTEQREWLRFKVQASNATWKLICSDVPLTIPVGTMEEGRDGWANGEDGAISGFEHEAIDLLKSWDRDRVKNVVFLSSGAGSAAQVRCLMDFDGDGHPLLYHELMVGPLSAAPGPKGRPGKSFGSTLLYGESGFFNFGFAQIVSGKDKLPHLLADVRGPEGEVRAGSALDLAPEH